MAWRAPTGPWPYLLVVMALSACGGPAAEPPRYELEGQILALRPERREVLIKHGDIKGFMPGMTMPFTVRNPALLDGKHPGDLVRARLVVGPNEAWLESLDTIGSAPVDEPAEIPAASFVVPLQPGDAVPETGLTDQDGQPFSLAAWRGRAALVTFIYVRCPLPQFCPLMDRRFAEVQRAILADPQLTSRAQLLSVSFDPEHDSPAALRAHAVPLGADPAVWRFATAPAETVDRFAATFGVNVIREADRTITHNLRTAVIGPDGRVRAIYTGSDWTPDQAVDDLRTALRQP